MKQPTERWAAVPERARILRKHQRNQNTQHAMSFQFSSRRANLNVITKLFSRRYSEKLHMMPIHKQQIPHSSMLPNFKLQCTRPMRSATHQVINFIRPVEEPTSQLQVSIFSLRPRINSVSQFAAVQYFLLATNKRHVCETLVGHDPSAPFA